MTTRTKSKAYLADPVSGQSRSSKFVSWSPYSDLGTSCNETEITMSHHRLSGGRWSGGGPWRLTRHLQSCKPSSTYVSTGLHDGTVRLGSARISTYPIGEYVHPSDASLFALGATAIARTEPTAPAFDLSTFIGEIRAEGLPNLPGLSVMERTKAAKAAGSEYLNVEFGWLPLVRGIRDFANTVKNSDDIIRSYQEHANVPVKRSYEWPSDEESHAEPCSFNGIPASGGTFQGGGRYQNIRQRKWFEAEYIYYLPTGSSTNDKVRRYGSYARKLLGVDLSPEVLWNLAPWSWAADWFGNVGDVMHNVSAMGQDGMVMRYGYIMCHTSKVILDSGTNANNGVFMTKQTLDESKTRLGATPFGFGVAYSGLSRKQLAIISAIGLSRW